MAHLVNKDFAELVAHGSYYLTWAMNVKIMLTAKGFSNTIEEPNPQGPILDKAKHTTLYFTFIKPIQNVAYKIIFQNHNVFKTWHDCLGHSGIRMMQQFTWSCHEYSKISQTLRFYVHHMCHREINHKTSYL